MNMNKEKNYYTNAVRLSEWTKIGCAKKCVKKKNKKDVECR